MESKGGQAVVKAAGLLMASTVLSRMLGYVRDIILAAAYGQSRITDAYQAAFSIPDFLYNLLIAGTVTAAFIPVFSSYIATGRQDEGWEVASTVFNITMTAMLAGVAAAALAAPYIVSRWLVPGFEPEALALTVTMTRVMLVQAFFMALSGISMGVLNSYRRFLGPAAAAVMYNVVIIACGLLLGRRLGIVSFAVGVSAGAVTQFAIQVAGLRRVGLRYRFIFHWRHPGVRRVFGLMIPVLVSYTLTQAALFFQQNISSYLPEGAVIAVRMAQRLMQMPVSIFAITAAIAIFPTLSGQAARREMEPFKQSFTFSLRSIFYITLPCAVGLAVLGRPIVRLLYQQGHFTAGDTAHTASILSFFCLGLCAQGGIHLLNRVFYALQNTWIPVSAAAGAMVLNIVLNYLLRGLLGTRGLALSYSLAGLTNLLALLLIVRRKIGPLGGRKLARSFGKTLGLSLTMGAAVFLTAKGLELYAVDIQSKAGQLIQVGGAVAVGCLVFLALSLLFKMEETVMVKGLVRRLFRRGKPAAS